MRIGRPIELLRRSRSYLKMYLFAELLPPPSQVNRTEDASGYRSHSCLFQNCLNDSQANSLVSCKSPKLMCPRFALGSKTPCGMSTPSAHEGESVGEILRRPIGVDDVFFVRVSRRPKLDALNQILFFRHFGIDFFSTRTGSTHPSGSRIVLQVIEFFDSSLDRSRGNPRDPGNVGDPAMPTLGRLNGRKTPTVFLRQGCGEITQTLLGL